MATIKQHWKQLKQNYRDWRRGYSDADVASLAAKCSPEWPQCLEPGSWVAVIEREMKALIATRTTLSDN